MKDNAYTNPDIIKEVYLNSANELLLEAMETAGDSTASGDRAMFGDISPSVGIATYQARNNPNLPDILE